MTAILAKKPKHVSNLKWQVYLALEDPLRAWPIPRLCGIVLVFLIVANAFLVGTTNQDIPPNLATAMYWFGVGSTAAFGVEYLCRIWVAPLMYPHLKARRARLRYLLSLMGLIDMLAVVPSVIMYAVGDYSMVSDAVRIVRLVRLIKLSRYMLGMQSIGRVLMKHRQEIIASFMMLALLAVAASVLVYDAEHEVQPDKFDSVLTGIYWAMTTITTTGYGDIVPITPLGRFFAFLVMVLSIAAVAIPGGIFSAGFIEEFRTQRHHASKRKEAAPAAAEAPTASPSQAKQAAGAEQLDVYLARETFDEFAAVSPAIPFVHDPEQEAPDASLGEGPAAHGGSETGRQASGEVE